MMTHFSFPEHDDILQQVVVACPSPLKIQLQLCCDGQLLWPWCDQQLAIISKCSLCCGRLMVYTSISQGLTWTACKMMEAKTLPNHDGAHFICHVSFSSVLSQKMCKCARGKRAIACTFSSIVLKRLTMRGEPCLQQINPLC